MASQALKPVLKRRLYEEIMEQLMEMISSGSMAAGDQLPSERQLMEQFQVGRPAVREALQNMARMGMISMTQGERARVAAPSFGNLLQSMSVATSGILRNSQRSLADLKEARLIFELQMVRIATSRATDEGISRLQDIHEQHSASLTNLSTFLRHDMQFHRQIASMTGNSIFPHLSETLISWLAEFYRDLVRLPGAEQLTLSEHQAILDAVKSRDPERAGDCMRVHLTRANKLYQSLAEQNRSNPQSDPHAK
jgi:GntR family transcriptional regulator, sialic acid-inducible nan operon repressor